MLDFKLQKKFLVVGVFVAVGLLAFSAVLFVTGVIIEPKIHLFTYEFDWNDEHGILLLKFESKDGALTTGKPIHVNGILFYPVSANMEESFMLHLPNTISPKYYNQLISDDIWKIKTTIDEKSVTIESRAIIAGFYNFDGIPLITDFDIVWTQEGFQNVYLIIDKKPITIEEFNKSDKVIIGNSFLIEQAVSIQPSNVNLQIQSNNYLIGLTLAIIALTILTGFTTLELLWFSKFSN